MIGRANIEIDPDVEDAEVEAEGFGQDTSWFEVAVTRTSFYRVEAVNADEAVDAVLQGYVDEPFDEITIDHEVQEV